MWGLTTNQGLRMHFYELRNKLLNSSGEIFVS